MALRTGLLKKLRLHMDAMGIDDEFILHVLREYNRMRLGGEVSEESLALVMRRFYNREHSTVRREYKAYDKHKTERFMDD